MRTSVRTLVGLAAATAVVGLAAPMALSAPASASTASKMTASSPDWDDYDYSRYWGSYWSRDYKAKARGHIDVSYNGEESNTVDIYGKLWDKDHRDSKCAYVKFRYTFWNDHEDDWDSDYYWYYNCNYNYPYSFSLPTLYDVSQVEVKVCKIYKWDAYDGAPNHPFKCGRWHEIYNGYDEDYNYDYEA